MRECESTHHRHFREPSGPYQRQPLLLLLRSNLPEFVSLPKDYGSDRTDEARSWARCRILACSFCQGSPDPRVSVERPARCRGRAQNCEETENRRPYQHRHTKQSDPLAGMALHETVRWELDPEPFRGRSRTWG